MTARVCACLGLALTLAADAGQAGRSSAEVRAFKRENPCPTTGLRRGPCPGFVVDHVHPLCAGGPDRVENMQWQSIPDAKIKDIGERRMCRAPRK